MFHPAILIAESEQRLVLGELGWHGGYSVEQAQDLQHSFFS
jgi:hypothetical protein